MSIDELRKLRKSLVEGLDAKPNEYGIDFGIFDPDFARELIADIDIQIQERTAGMETEDSDPAQK